MRKLIVLLVAVMVLGWCGVAGAVDPTPETGDLGIGLEATSSSVNISWDSPPYYLPEFTRGEKIIHPALTFNSALQYIIHRSTADYPTMFYRLGTVSPGTTTFTDSTVEPGKRYGYGVSAVVEHVYGVSKVFQGPVMVTVPTQTITQQPVEQSPSLQKTITPTQAQSITESNISKPTIAEGTITTYVNIDSTKMIVNGKVITLDVAPKIENNRTMVPLRAIAEALGAEVQWDNYTKTVTIIKK